MTEKRRKLLYTGAAMLAALAGIAWQGRKTEKTVGSSSTGAVSAGSQDPLWGLTLDTPQGQSLALQSLRGQPLIINFWATWCPPCIEELPLLNAFHRQSHSNGWQILGIAVDRLEPVQKFLQRLPLEFPVVLAGMEGLALSKKLGNDTNGLPFSVLIAADGTILDRKIGKLEAADLANWKQLA